MREFTLGRTAEVRKFARERDGGGRQIFDFSSRKRKLLLPTGWTFHYRIPRAIRAPRNPSRVWLSRDLTRIIQSSVDRKRDKDELQRKGSRSVHPDRHALFPGAVGPRYAIAIYLHTVLQYLYRNTDFGYITARQIANTRHRESRCGN